MDPVPSWIHELASEFLRRMPLYLASSVYKNALRFLKIFEHRRKVGVAQHFKRPQIIGLDPSLQIKRYRGRFPVLPAQSDLKFRKALKSDLLHQTGHGSGRYAAGLRDFRNGAFLTFLFMAPDIFPDLTIRAGQRVEMDADHLLDVHWVSPSLYARYFIYSISTRIKKPVSVLCLIPSDSKGISAAEPYRL